MSNLGGENTQSVDDKGKEESQGCSVSVDNVILRMDQGEVILFCYPIPIRYFNDICFAWLALWC